MPIDKLDRARAVVMLAWDIYQAARITDAGSELEACMRELYLLANVAYVRVLTEELGL